MIKIRFLIAVGFLSACSAVRVTSVDPTDTLRAARQDITTSDSLSPLSTQALRQAGLNQDDVIENGVDEQTRKQFELLADPLDKVFIESEVAIGRAQLLERSEPERAVPLYLAAASLSYQGFLLPQCQRPVDIRCDSLKVFYARAVRGVVSFLDKNGWDPARLPELKTGAGFRFALGIAHAPTLEDPREYSSIVPAASIGLEGLKNRYGRAGIGVSLVACRPRKDNSRAEEYLPRVGACLPLTAVISFPNTGCPDGGICPATLELINSSVTESYKVRGVELPLAADFSAPLASLIEKTGMGGWDGLFDALDGNEDLLKQTGFYTTEPYNVGKIPLITVHGLFSNPLTWIDVHNDLMGDPIIRKNFQLWHYLYPTSLPLLQNASTFRRKLDELNSYIASVSPKGAAGGDLVIISHSMGGILSRTTIDESSEPLKDYFFQNPAELQELDSETQRQVDSLFDFSRRPYVKRVIFVAVPHRGSDVADNWIGAIGEALISLPTTMMEKTATALKKTRNMVRPDMATAFDEGGFTSIDELSATNPVLVQLSDLPIDSRVPYHSIIGDQGKGDSPQSSDGVVAYTSSHLDGAQSELIVPADHTAHADPRAVLEIRRILRLHVDELDDSPSQKARSTIKNEQAK